MSGADALPDARRSKEPCAPTLKRRERRREAEERGEVGVLRLQGKVEVFGGQHTL